MPIVFGLMCLISTSEQDMSMHLKALLRKVSSESVSFWEIDLPPLCSCLSWRRTISMDSPMHEGWVKTIKWRLLHATGSNGERERHAQMVPDRAPTEIEEIR